MIHLLVTETHATPVTEKTLFAMYDQLEPETISKIALRIFDAPGKKVRLSTDLYGSMMYAAQVANVPFANYSHVPDANDPIPEAFRAAFSEGNDDSASVMDGNPVYYLAVMTAAFMHDGDDDETYARQMVSVFVSPDGTCDQVPNYLSKVFRFPDVDPETIHTMIPYAPDITDEIQGYIQSLADAYGKALQFTHWKGSGTSICPNPDCSRNWTVRLHATACPIPTEEAENLIVGGNMIQ